MADLATQYYIKAMDNYPIDLKETIESLDYALSYDDEHTGAHCLMGRFCASYSYNYDEAIYHFEKALSLDINYTETYYYYSKLLIQLNSFEKAKRLLKFAYNVRGIHRPSILNWEAKMYEKQNKLKKAKKRLAKAINIAMDNGEIKYYEGELKRVSGKFKQQNKKKRKKNK